MKAIVQDRYGSADVLELRDIDTPEIDDDGVLLRVLAASVFIGDWHLMAGMPLVFRLAAGLRAPRSRVRGQDVAGRIEAVGSNVTAFRPGEEVFGTCDGSFAEYATARTDRIAPKPANLSFEEAATVPITGTTALQALRNVGRVEPGQRVLIIGAAGGVGSFAVQIAKAFGAHATGVCSSGQVDLVRSIGADDVIDYTRTDFSRAGQRYDLILETAGRHPVSRLRRALATDGTLVIVGSEGGGRWFGGVGRQLRAQIRSPFVRQTLRMFVAKQNADDLVVLKDLIEAGKVAPVTGMKYRLGEVPEAMRHVQAGHASGKTIITV